MLGKPKRPMLIKDMLQEELQNSLQIQKDYQKAMAAIPPGALVRKVIGGRAYYYLAHRQGKKVQFDYVGRLSPAELRKYEEDRQFRVRYRNRLRGIKEQIRFLRKTLRGHTSV